MNHCLQIVYLFICAIQLYMYVNDSGKSVELLLNKVAALHNFVLFVMSLLYFIHIECHGNMHKYRGVM